MPDELKKAIAAGDGRRRAGAESSKSHAHPIRYQHEAQPTFPDQKNVNEKESCPWLTWLDLRAYLAPPPSLGLPLPPPMRSPILLVTPDSVRPAPCPASGVSAPPGADAVINKSRLCTWGLSWAPLCVGPPSVINKSPSAALFRHHSPFAKRSMRLP
eukprot:gene9530-12469_t